MKPYKEKRKGSFLIREFSKKSPQKDFIWHRDKHDRCFKVIKGSGWRFQFDNKKPVAMNEGDIFFIPKNEYHRILKGDSFLKILIYESKEADENKLLQQFISESLDAPLLETAKGISDIDNSKYVLIAKRGNGYKIEIRTFDKPEPIGSLIMRPKEDCDGAFVISGSSAKKGWGPLLYDIAMEWATKHGNGLAPDRLRVSPDALKVWEFYDNKRQDVVSFPLSDDCSHENKSLSKRYTKSPETIEALRAVRNLKIE